MESEEEEKEETPEENIEIKEPKIITKNMKNTIIRELNNEEDDNINNNNDIIEEEIEKNRKIRISKIFETNTKMLLYINPISKQLIEYLKNHNIEEYLDDNSNYGLVGLTNLGNTCFMNSAIQCLSNCEYLTKYFLSGLYKKEINCSSKYSSGGNIANSYSDLIYKLWNSSKPYITPYNFHNTFTSYVKIFSDSSQHDSHEMLIYLLEKLHEDLNRNEEKEYKELNEKQDNENDIEASNRWWEIHLKRDDSIIMDLFSGQYKSTLRCPFCDKISITYDQFSCLELPIENKCFSGTSYVINEKDNKIRKINLIFGEEEIFRDICDKINCQKSYKAILCRNNKMYLACLKDEQNLYELIKYSHEQKNDLHDRIIFYEYEKKELDNKLLFFVVPIIFSKSFNESRGIYQDEERYLFFPKIFYYSPDEKIQKFYKDLKKYYHKLYKFDEKTNFPDEKIKLRIVNNLTMCTKTKDPCDYCKSAECISCEFKFGKDMTMGELQKTQSKKRSFVMYLEIPNDTFEKGDYNSIKIYDNYLNDEEDFVLSNELTLENCFNSFSRCEKLDETNEWYCSKCKEHRRGYKQLELFRLPKYLILQLKRFKNQFGFFFNSKNSTFVKFPLEGLNLNKYLVGPKNIDYLYDLIAVSQHYGASFGGHYTSVCKKINDWYEFDDDDVTQIDEDQIINSNAYVLIYELRE
jgi:ubiquitin carboxyl-terminal hydrolase 4/11/15